MPDELCKHQEQRCGNDYFKLRATGKYFSANESRTDSYSSNRHALGFRCVEASVMFGWGLLLKSLPVCLS